MKKALGAKRKVLALIKSLIYSRVKRCTWAHNERSIKVDRNCRLIVNTLMKEITSLKRLALNLIKLLGTYYGT